MTDSRTTKSIVPFGPIMATVLLLAVSGCDSERKQDADASATSEQAPDPVAEAHKRGQEWAERNSAKLVTDCGALADADERFGCADYINHPEQHTDQ